MRKKYSLLSLFSGAGGLDLGFESEGFDHLQCVELDQQCVNTLALNRPQWNVHCGDVTKYRPAFPYADVLIGGPPCQGFSLGGNRDACDSRNVLFLEMIRIAKLLQPRVVVIENVLNLRTMEAPWSGKNFAEEIADQLKKIGYSVRYDVFKVCYFGVPQTRRRFIFVAVKGDFPKNYELPMPDVDPTTIRHALFNLGQNDAVVLPNHSPTWGFKSQVHTNHQRHTHKASSMAVPFRISRTGSDGHPIRSFDEPFPAVDTATVWGWAKGHVTAVRVEKDRETGKHIRNPNASTKLWRISADEMRTFTHREYARLQTFPDDWVFTGQNKRDIHKQIGNAVPVEFARRVAENVRHLLDAQDKGVPYPAKKTNQLRLEL